MPTFTQLCYLLMAFSLLAHYQVKRSFIIPVLKSGLKCLYTSLIEWGSLRHSSTHLRAAGGLEKAPAAHCTAFYLIADNEYSLAEKKKNR